MHPNLTDLSAPCYSLNLPEIIEMLHFPKIQKISCRRYVEGLGNTFKESLGLRPLI